MKEVKQDNWFKRHPVWTGVIVIFILLAIIGSFSSDNSADPNKNNLGNVQEPTIQDQNAQDQQQNVQKTWHEVTTFTGTSDKKTDTFNIQGDRFRLTYTVNPSNDYSIFYLYVYEPGSDIYTESFSLESGTEESVSYEGSGEYYLDIKAANLNSWTVKVEDHY